MRLFISKSTTLKFPNSLRLLMPIPTPTTHTSDSPGLSRSSCFVLPSTGSNVSCYVSSGLLRMQLCSFCGYFLCGDGMLYQHWATLPSYLLPFGIVLDKLLLCCRFWPGTCWSTSQKFARLCLPCARIKCMCHHTWLILFFPLFYFYVHECFACIYVWITHVRCPPRG